MATGKPYAGPTDSPFAPDVDQIRRQFEFWFVGSLIGTIEVGWFDAHSGQLNRFERFDLTDIDEAAHFIVARNSVPGQSIYFRPALIHKTAPWNLNDKHFSEAPGPWCDLDGEGAADNARTIYSLCRPNMAVVTGRKPHTRAQLFWRGEDMLRDGAELRNLNTRICRTLSGDSKVINPTSLMRIAGTIAWPLKPGREIERTELVLFEDDRPKSYPAGAIDKAFPETAHQQQSSSRQNFSFDPETGECFDEAAQQAKPNFERDGISPADLLKKIHAGEEWHNNALALVGHWISRGWCDAEILAASVSFTLAGYTWQDTINDVAGMIRSGREKWNTPNPEHDVGAAEAAAAPFPLLWFDEIEANTDTVDFVEDTLTEGGMSVIYGPSNCGKTFWMSDLAFHVAMGRTWQGKQVDQGGVIYCALEGGFGIKNRVAAFKKHYGLEGQKIPFAVVPVSINLLDPNADVPRLIELINAAAATIAPIPVKLVIIDTLARALAGGNENSSEDMGALVTSADRVREATKAHFAWVHHCGKDEARGARGHSSLRAATDTEIEITRPQGATSSLVSIQKQRDLEKGADSAFSLRQVVLGTNRRDKPVTSCVVDFVAPEEAAKRRPKLTPKEVRALEILDNVFSDSGKPAPTMRNIPNVSVVEITAFREALKRTGVTDQFSATVERTQWNRIKEALDSKGFIRMEGAWLWRP